MYKPEISFMDQFDDLVHLAKEDPESFDRVRKTIIHQTINSAPQERQENLHRYQWRIDQETRKHDNGLGCCIKLSAMMSDRMLELSRQLDLICQNNPEQISQKFASIQKAVIPLKVAQG